MITCNIKAPLFATLIAMSLFAESTNASLISVNPVTDTITDLTINWDWQHQDNQPYTDTVGWDGQFWKANITANFTDGNWTISTEYLHKLGPHGEVTEPEFHVHTFGPNVGLISLAGVDDHDNDQHIQAHKWTFTGDASMSPAFNATLNVNHVPLPASWTFLFGGIALLNVMKKRNPIRPNGV